MIIDKFLIQLGRGRQSWGAGNMANLALDEKNSPPYEYLLSGVNLGKFKFRSFNGFLESDSIGFNRYISSKGRNITTKNLLLSLSLKP